MKSKFLECGYCGCVNFECSLCAAGMSYEIADSAQLQNRAAEAEQQVLALQQRLDMANKLNTEAREQMAKLAMLPAGFYGDKWLSQDEFAAIWEALQ